MLAEAAVLAEVAEVAASMGGSCALEPCPVVASVVRILVAQADPWELDSGLGRRVLDP